jgi:hypothetical protein
MPLLSEARLRRAGGKAFYTASPHKMFAQQKKFSTTISNKPEDCSKQVFTIIVPITDIINSVKIKLKLSN